MEKGPAPRQTSGTSLTCCWSSQWCKRLWEPGRPPALAGRSLRWGTRAGGVFANGNRELRRETWCRAGAPDPGVSSSFPLPAGRSRLGTGEKGLGPTQHTSGHLGVGTNGPCPSPGWEALRCCGQETQTAMPRTGGAEPLCFAGRRWGAFRPRRSVPRRLMRWVSEGQGVGLPVLLLSRCPGLGKGQRFGLTAGG